MKSYLLQSIWIVFVCMLLANLPAARGQLLNRIKNEVKGRAANRAVNESGNVTDNAIDKTKNGIKNILKKDSQQENTSSNNEVVSSTAGNTVATKSAMGKANYKSYDFVPGDKIIFQPDLSGEADAELPARFTVVKGNAEIQSHEGEKILHLNAGGYVTVTPLMKEAAYLPEQFTVEFDMMYENERTLFDQVNDFNVYFFKPDDNNYDGYGLYSFVLHSNERVGFGVHGVTGQKVPSELAKALQTHSVWHHIALYVRQNVAKAYVNEYRVTASNALPTGAGKLAIKTDGRYGFKIKNFRLAAGGDDKYNKIVTDGKFVTHGIQFDVAKATIKPESMGALNEIVKMMKMHDELKFEINGHTDSDGTAEANMKLSEARARSVKDKLVEMGIAADRLTTKGNGSAQPIDDNSTQEGKANNRRVEFIKI